MYSILCGNHVLPPDNHLFEILEAVFSGDLQGVVQGMDLHQQLSYLLNALSVRKGDAKMSELWGNQNMLQLDTCSM